MKNVYVVIELDKENGNFPRILGVFDQRKKAEDCAYNQNFRGNWNNIMQYTVNEIDKTGNLL